MRKLDVFVSGIVQLELQAVRCVWSKEQSNKRVQFRVGKTRKTAS